VVFRAEGVWIKGKNRQAEFLWSNQNDNCAHERTNTIRNQSNQ